MSDTANPKQPAFQALLISSTLLCFATGAQADGTFFQFDLARNASDTVLGATRGKMSFGANYSIFEDGWSAGVYAARDYTIENVATIKIGPSIGKSDASNGLQFGAKVIVERYQPADFGFVFMSGQLNTIENDWFALVQIGNGKGLSVDLTAGGSDTYSEQSIAVNYRLDNGPTSLRGGYRFDAQEVFVGMSINTY